MENTVKRKILKSLRRISLELQQEDLDLKTKCDTILDISILVKIIDDFEKLKPDIKNILDKKRKERGDER